MAVVPNDAKLRGRLDIAGVLWCFDAAASATAIPSDALDSDISDTAHSPQVPAVSVAPSEPVTTVRGGRLTCSASAHAQARTRYGRFRSVNSRKRGGPADILALAPSSAGCGRCRIGTGQAAAAKTGDTTAPPLSLVGTIAGDDEKLRNFSRSIDQGGAPLKVGEDYQGWKLQAIRGREVTMQKDEQAAVLSLPEPGDNSGGSARLTPVGQIKMPVVMQQ